MATKKDLELTNVLEFKKRVEIGLQQEKSYLRQAVTEIDCEDSEASAIREVFGAREASFIDDDLGATKFENTKVTRRWVKFRNAGWAERIDPFATLDSGINPFVPYAKLAVAALHRLHDEVILEGMLGTNWTGKLGGTKEEFPEDQILPMKGDKGGFFATLIGQLIQAKAWWMENDVDLSSERLYVGVPSDVWAQMFALEKATSKDYIDTASLLAGKIEYFCGFQFINIEKVPGKPKFPSSITFPKLKTGVKYALPCWCSSGVVFTQRRHITSSYSKNPERWDAPQLLATASFGATRVEPKKVLCLEVTSDSLTYTGKKEIIQDKKAG